MNGTCHKRGKRTNRIRIRIAIIVDGLLCEHFKRAGHLLLPVPLPHSYNAQLKETAYIFCKRAVSLLGMNTDARLVDDKLPDGEADSSSDGCDGHSATGCDADDRTSRQASF